MTFLKKIGIVGAGNYGTAIAQCFSEKAEEVFLISEEETTSTDINQSHANPQYLPGIRLNDNISCSSTFSQIQNCDIIFLAVPTSVVLSICRQIKDFGISVPIVLCSKGFDVENGRLQSDLFEEILNNDYAIFSGPSFANEIAQGLPAGVNIAGKNFELSRNISKSLSTTTFKIEAINDYIGLQVAGALKNVLAIGCGILSGLKLGDNATAQLITNGIKEMAELAAALGGEEKTFFELGGVGDVILTCSSKRSRNILFGEHLAAGGNLENWKGALAEGAFAVEAIPLFREKYDLILKIFSRIHQIIHGKKPASEIIRE
ncbi:MAG: NAD(P)H-dependent glycerol-3-phosphate dehydrogenase [Holosporaceae bacterium]|nr:NAD(P)H-dependent glycerol-3-phosphate dehydrogenase [Holosporaceae bacterium]